MGDIEVENERTVRLAAYAKGTLLHYDDVELDGVEYKVRHFVDELDKRANTVRITLFDGERKITAWNTPVDEFFLEWIESLIEELLDERLYDAVERSYDG
jgi:hypothetical protein